MKIAYFNPNGDSDEFRAALSAFPDVQFAVARGEADIPAVLADAQVLVTANRIYTPGPAKLIRDHGKALRWIAFTTSGFDKARASGLPAGVTVTNMSGLKAWQVAEHAMHLMLALARQSRAALLAQDAAEWARNPLTPLMDNISFKSLLVVGAGAIGQDIARKAKAFDMRVTGISRSPTAPPNFDAMLPRSELVAAVRQADCVVVAALAEAETFGMISRDVIAAMQPHAWLVNIARGSLVDESALIDALRDRRIAGAALDVQALEPTPADNPLWTLDNVIITPHVAGAGSKGDGATHASVFVRNLRRWIAGERLDKIAAET